MATPPPEDSGRVPALDILRGLAVLGMMLSGVVPFKLLPGWMYHAQLPPPEHTFDPTRAGISWVDLVFPTFIFSMGAAIPLAMRRVQGAPGLVFVRRGALLLLFAIAGQHLRPYAMDPTPGPKDWGLGLAGFVGLAAAFFRVPSTWPAWSGWLIRGAGLAVVLGICFGVRYPDGGGFSWQRVDIILAVLAWMALLGGLVWLWTRQAASRDLLRLLVMGIVLAAILAKSVPDSPLNEAWNFSALMPLAGLEFLPYLLVMVPGLIVGDLLAEPREISRPAGEAEVWAGMLAALVIPLMLVVFYARFSALWALPVLAAGALLAQGTADSRTRAIFFWGYALLAVGCVLEPFEGGIKKDPKTLAYLLSTAGLAALGLAVLLTGEGALRRWMGLAEAVGQNPMLAYVGITNLIAPLWALILGGWVAEMTPGPWLGLGRALLQTALLGLAVWGLTRLRVVMRT